MNRSLERNMLAAAVLAACPAITSNALAAETAANYAALGKDVRILAQVLETATAPDTGRHRWEHGARIEGLYLAGQGMVFRVRLGGAHFEHAFFEAPVPPVPPVPPAGAAGAGMTIEHDVMIDTEEMNSVMEEAMIDAQDAMDEMGFESGIDKQTRDELRSLRETQRNASREFRDRQRALAEASRGGKTPSQADRTAADKARQDFEAANQKLRARIASLRAEQQKKWAAKVQQTETALLDALCSYAGSTRRLAASEHVSLILEGAEDDEDADGRHRIWVIRKSDLDACASSAQAADFLQKKATNYVL